MAGNSARRGAVRKTGTKKGAVVGSGGKSGKSREGRGPTPPAEMRKGHPAARKAAAAKKPGAGSGKGGAGKSSARGTKVTGGRGVRHGKDLPETVVGRNPIVSCRVGRRGLHQPCAVEVR